ncbi:uncharacterized protein LACBIDRAFT_318037 [Laccaria bicolor S238N-H82]|uniref:Predicted protein n=1 Tax=Laccaria bicolor (strain S238N-H82 / ATCC MYA-4686) TaxID=486041 RepID=B0D5U1_LACBS|nr:uncharacterized protein LACBIDRAFT_318037 [Laccaria bicolor S238N-H82]EDR10077.1 predicted protein [Laccaria bicolor S238N-H82]|eukprot:XP_001879462.1 predicted protein [Laccaria bicolor S238N-H82]
MPVASRFAFSFPTIPPYYIPLFIDRYSCRFSPPVIMIMTMYHTLLHTSSSVVRIPQENV